MSLVKQNGCDVKLLVFSPVGEYFRSGPRHAWQQRVRSIHNDFGLEVNRLPLPPARTPKLWQGKALLKCWLRKAYRSEQRVIIHCRGTQAANLALIATKGDTRFRVIFDCRGLEAPEFLYVRGYRSPDEAPENLAIEAGVYEGLQQQAALSCHAMICVSEAMKREVIKRWSVPENKIFVIPCCTDVEAGARAYEGRDEMRRKLGLSDRFVVAYCGSLKAWQMPVESLAVFRAIASIRPDAHFLAITTHAERMVKLAEQNDVSTEQRTIITLPHTEVPAYLAAADVALLIREDSPVNRVASPVKFAEYLTCGVPVILTEGVGDYSGLVEQEGLGCVLPVKSGFVNTSSSLIDFAGISTWEQKNLSLQCLEVSKKKLGWDVNITILEYIYG
jgi:glycosyltransferase involved in cell wall biosynthesis